MKRLAVVFVAVVTAWSCCVSSPASEHGMSENGSGSSYAIRFSATLN